MEIFEEMSNMLRFSKKLRPFTLKILASEKYFMTLACSYTVTSLTVMCDMMSGFHRSKDLRSSCEMFVSRMDKKILRRTSTCFDLMMAYFCNAVKTLPADVLSLLRRHVAMRAELHTSVDIDFLFQLFLCDSLVIQKEHVYLLVLLGLWKKKFPGIKTLASYQYCLCYDVLDLCLPMLPNLIELKADVFDKLSSLRVIRDRAKNLEVLSLPKLHSTVAKNDDLCRTFFRGTPLSTVMKQFSEGELVPLSFPKLKYLALPFRFPVCLPCFRMLIFYYCECHFEWEFLNSDTSPVSIFDASLCPAINLNPCHQQGHCELRFEDLRFSYVDEVLAKWINLESLLLIIGESSVCIDQHHAHLKLQAILEKCNKLVNLKICVVQKNCEPCLKTVIGVCKKYGRNIKELCLIDNSLAISHEKMVALLNCFTNITTLKLMCSHRHPFCDKSVIINSFLKVKKISVIILDKLAPLQAIHTFALFVSAVLKKCPNVTDLTLPMESFFLAMLEKLNINSQLCSLTFHLYTTERENLLFILRLCHYVQTTCVKEVAAYQPRGFEHPHLDISDDFNEFIIRFGILIRYHDRKFSVNPW